MKQIDPNLILSHLDKAISGLRAVYLYGSFLSESFSDGSDLDIAIKVESRLDNQKRWRIQEDLVFLLLGKFKNIYNIDVHQSPAGI